MNGTGIKVKKLVFSALMAALVYAATMMIQIPSPMNGYVNLGDCFVLLSGWLLGPWYGAAALIFRALGKTKLGYLVSGLVGETIMVAGYFGYAGLMLGKGMAAALSIPGNIVQGVMGLAIGIVLAITLEHTKVTNKLLA